MKKDEFRTEWEKSGESLVRFPAALLDSAEMPDVAKEFLTTVGLPAEAAPCLGFEPRMPPPTWIADPLWEVLVSGNMLMIGSDSSGNPVVMGADGGVKVLDHLQGWAPR